MARAKTDPSSSAISPLRSMTGFGAARRESDSLAVGVEAKAVNGRFLKVSLKAPPSLSAHEVDLEAMAKQKLRRGSVTITVHLQHTSAASVVAIDEDVVRAYQEVFRRLGLPEDRIPTMPGVVAARSQPVSDDDWQRVADAVGDALDQLVVMREHEGGALAITLGGMLDAVDDARQRVAERSPAVVLEYRDKLAERIAALLVDQQVEPDPEALAREVAQFADRCDITEEIDRLVAHIDQARQLLAGGGEVGRKLEFLAQEMHREVNTVGSKSNDIELSRHVVDLKSTLEKIKEQVANIE